MEKPDIELVSRDKAGTRLRKQAPPSLRLDHPAADRGLDMDDAVKSSQYYSASSSVIPFLSPLVLSPTSPSPDVAKEEWATHFYPGRGRGPPEHPVGHHPSDSVRSSYDKPGPGCLCSAFESCCILQPQLR
ncbi:hypothetical protein MLD38_008366 [Melastoma candidum]|uniref:Uncharacterized protein n=1 Tax=Melastoma candidum TaxID=119954 RepID=A0ACB9RTP8_9MYRT|nr:hypothetical protein MLD38_008366 [Melastoma candidum]